MPQEIISQFDRKIALPIETYRQVLTISNRDSIPTSIRWQGMIVYVVSDSMSYILKGGTTNSDWVELGSLVNLTVRNNLTSTSTTDALSANQGRILNDTKIGDAPIDGAQYARKDGAWSVVVGGGGADASWGTITGTLSAQTDLQSALNNKLNLSGGTITGALTVNGEASFKFTPLKLIGTSTGDSNVSYISLNESNGSTRQGYIGFGSGSNSDFTIYNDRSSTSLKLDGSGGLNGFKYLNGSNTYNVWHSGNDGAGSGLDADLLDGQGGGSYLRSDAADSKTSGNLTIFDNIRTIYGSGGTNSQIFNSGRGAYIDLYNCDLFIRDSSTTRFTFERSTGKIQATAYKTPAWEIVQNGNNLEFKYSGVVKFRMNTTGIVNATDFKLGL
ncbi:tail protein [Cellulophaga phage phi17:1]|uniref:Phage tail protein n=1 Tax=Cellulophaga phage phi17:1 TaxID=1327980 RepID=S0A1H0_9CAUD|nr:tail protein [Cellulophaga phage phi17:1]AGO48337.1 phage tail protein [Cellulophaga phage phi17:1]